MLPNCADLGPNTTQVALACLTLFGSALSLILAARAHEKATETSLRVDHNTGDIGAVREALNGNGKKEG